MTRLSSPELRIIRTMLIKEFGSVSPLLDQLASLEFDIRHMTGTGYFVHFTNAEQLPRIDKLNAELSKTSAHPWTSPPIWSPSHCSFEMVS